MRRSSLYILLGRSSVLYVLLLLSFFFIITTPTVTGQDVESTLTSYTTQSVPSYPCTRLFRVDGQIGCSTSEPKGIIGYLYDGISDTNFFNFFHLTPSFSSVKYTILLPPERLILSNLTALSALPWFAGIIALAQSSSSLLNDHSLRIKNKNVIAIDRRNNNDGRFSSSLSSSSSSSLLPNDYSPAPKELPIGFAQEYVWNPVGRELIFTNFPYPIVAVDIPTGNSLLSKAYRNQEIIGINNYPQWSIQFQYYMGPSTLNSVECLDNESCLPLGGQSVWGALGGLDSSLDTRIEKKNKNSISLSSSSSFFTQKITGIYDKTKHQHRLQYQQKEVSSSTSSTLSDPSSTVSSTKKIQRPVLMAVVTMDAAELFHELSYGADSAVSGIVTLLATAEIFSRNNGNQAAELPYQILFGLFQAEAWGRIGSRRWINEVQSFTCEQNVTAERSPTGRPYCAFPLRYDVSFSTLSLSDIKYVLAVDQVGRSNPSAFYIHTEAVSPSPGSQWISNVLQALSSTSTNLPYPILPAITGRVPPPTPILSFQELAPSIGAAVISEYNGAFSNPYFHSRFDNAENINASTVAASATLLAQSLYALASNKSTPTEAANAVPYSLLVSNITLIEEMITCITVNAQCSLFQQAFGVDSATLSNLVPNGPLSLYTSVYNQPYTLSTGGYVLQPTPLEAFVRNMLAYYTRTNTSKTGTCTNNQDCQTTLGKEFECLLSECVISNAFYHDALSPALAATRTQGEYNIDISITSAIDPLWTEPYWSSNIGITLFLRDSPSLDGGMIAAGVLLTIITGIGSYYLVGYLDIHYKVP